MWEDVRNEKGYLWPLFEYWFTNNYKRFYVEEISEHETVVHNLVKTRTADAKNGHRQLKNVKEQLKVILMDHILSNGKSLRHATFRDCAVEGGWLTAVAKQGKPKEIVGKRLTEKDLHSLMTRVQSK